MNSYQYGLFAEQKVAEYLEELGYTIKEQRYKTSYGEIDIIAILDEVLVFFEVKARRRFLHDENISSAQIKRNSNAASFFLSQYEDYSNYQMRFDFIYR